MSFWDTLAEKALAGEAPSREEALATLQADEDELLAMLHAAFGLRKEFFGRDVRLHLLRNAKSGMCRENCAFCSQAAGSYTGVDTYRMQSVEQLLAGARHAHKMGAVKYCMVTATRGPSEEELERICEATRKIKAEMDIHICASLGILTEQDAARLVEAGVDRFNHNLESSREYFPKVVQTHTFDDRVRTVKIARAAGMEACCGGIMGMGESVEDRVDLALTLRELEVESIPVNFFNPRPGTPLEHVEQMSPVEALKCLCMFRFVNPTRDIRVAGGREVVLRHMQALALYPANSMFSEGYLTTEGQGYDQDMAMLEEAGFRLAEVVHEEE